MTTEAQNRMLQTKRLLLTRRRLLRYYAGTFYTVFFTIGSIIFFLTLIDFFHPAMLIMLVIPIMGLWIFINQYRGLRLRTFETKFLKSKNHELAVKTIKSLKWKMSVNSNGFIEAYSPTVDMKTFGDKLIAVAEVISMVSGEGSREDEMISIVITDNQVLINSISNVNSGSPLDFPFGKNKRNVKRFIDRFEALALDNSKIPA
ncbi:MAG: hypothetical protein WCF67_01890 [Chitinophagaceae bacterium]